jgi:hypothetical protein
MKGFPGLPVRGADPRQVASVVNRLNLGKLNCVGTVTLAAGQASTTVTDSRADASSHIGLTPLTPDAAAEAAGGALHIADRGAGSFTIAHANNAQTDRIFSYLIIG